MLSSMMFLVALSSVTFFQTNSPVLMVILIILTSFNLCVIIKKMFFTAWFSYILFLIFLGGLMVVFIYICSIASNEQILINSGLPILITSALIFFSFTLESAKKVKFLNMAELIQNMFCSFSISMVYISMTYLLLTLFVAVQVSKMKFGPMRTKKI